MQCQAVRQQCLAELGFTLHLFHTTDRVLRSIHLHPRPGTFGPVHRPIRMRQQRAEPRRWPAPQGHTDAPAEVDPQRSYLNGLLERVQQCGRQRNGMFYNI